MLWKLAYLALHCSLGSALFALVHHFIMVIRISKVVVGCIES